MQHCNVKVFDTEELLSNKEQSVEPDHVAFWQETECAQYFFNKWSVDAGSMDEAAIFPSGQQEVYSI